MRDAAPTIRAARGVARFCSDNGYLVGPPKKATMAFNAFKKAIEDKCGLTVQTHKCEFFSADGNRPLCASKNGREAHRAPRGGLHSLWTVHRSSTLHKLDY